MPGEAGAAVAESLESQRLGKLHRLDVLAAAVAIDQPLGPSCRLLHGIAGVTASARNPKRPQIPWILLVGKSESSILLLGKIGYGLLSFSKLRCS